jgi:hypothetical protein
VILSFQEFALFVQTSTPEDSIAGVIDRIIRFRDGIKKAAGNVRKYDRQNYQEIAAQIDKKATTLDDYALMIFVPS